MIDKNKKSFRTLLAEGPQLGLGHMYPAAGIVERIGRDWDWIWIDGQHGQLGYSDIVAAVRASDVIGRPSVVRVPGLEYGAIGRALDTATDGVMIPMVEDADQAREAARAAKFPPLGERSYGGRRPVDLYGRGYANADREQPLLICQIESDAGLRNVAAIAAVEGVDALFFGPDDMALRAGLPMDQPRPEGYFTDALKAVAEAAASHGKLAGAVFPTPAAASEGIQLGYRMLVCTGDVPLLAVGSNEKAQAFRQCLPESGDGMA